VEYQNIQLILLDTNASLSYKDTRRYTPF